MQPREGAHRRSGGELGQIQELENSRLRGLCGHDHSGRSGQGGPRAGMPNRKFSVGEYVEQYFATSQVRSGNKKASKTIVGFTNWAEKEMGWSASRAKMEWDFLIGKAKPGEIEKTYDRLNGEEVTWLMIDVEKYIKGEAVVGQTKSLQCHGKKIKNPTKENIENTQRAMVDGHMRFNDKFFEKVGGGVLDRANNLSCGIAGQIDSRTHTFASLGGSSNGTSTTSGGSSGGGGNDSIGGGGASTQQEPKKKTEGLGPRATARKLP